MRAINRRVLGRAKWPYLISLGIAGGLMIKGFIWLLDAAVMADRDYPELHGQLGAQLMIAGGYLLLGAILWARRRLKKLSYLAGGYFLAERTVVLSDTAVINSGGINRIEAPWSKLHGWFEDKKYFYIQLEPAIALFIPKRAVATAELEQSLRDLLAQKLKQQA